MTSLLEQDDEMIFVTMKHVISPDLIRKALVRERQLRKTLDSEYSFDAFFNYQRDSKRTNIVIVEIGF